MLIFNKEKINEILKDLNIDKETLDTLSKIDFTSLLREHNWRLYDYGSDREVYIKDSYDTVIKIDVNINLEQISIQGEIECNMFKQYKDKMAQIYGASANKAILFCEFVYAHVPDLEDMMEKYPNSDIIKSYSLTNEDYEDFLQLYVRDFFYDFDDIHMFNVGINKQNKLVVLDAGYGDTDGIILSSTIYNILKNNLKSNLRSLANNDIVNLIEDLEKGNKLTVELMRKYFPNFKEE